MLYKTLIIFILFGLFSNAQPLKIWAQSQEPEFPYQCVGQGLALYMNAIIDGAGDLPNIRLLSPAFNMTSYLFDGIVNAMADSDARFQDLDGIAGNVYNTQNRGITSWLDEKLANSNVSSKPVYLTEVGEKDVADKAIPRQTGITRLGDELDKFKSTNNRWRVQGYMLFNALGTGNNSQFGGFIWSPTEITTICRGACTNGGVNSASVFSRDVSFYQQTANLGMKYTIEISNGDPNSTQDGLRKAFDAGLTPIIRIGIGDSANGFEEPGKYVEFLTGINAWIDQNYPGKLVFAIAGPNEPDTEFWATPYCKPKQLSTKKTPLEEGFTPLRYACNDIFANPEYHPLRPYPGSPCDPLIPRSVPEAPVTAEKKFNTFACGTPLIPKVVQRFDPYGDNSQYEGLPPITLPDGSNYAHTACQPLLGGNHATCYRTSAFDLRVDFSQSNLGILGNTQNNTLTDEQKVNEYLSWYLAGTPQIGDQIELDARSPEDVDRVVNFSGPLRKLMPFDLLSVAKDTLSEAIGDQVHDYNLAGNTTLNDWPTLMQKLLAHVPFSSMEDTAGEVVLSVFRDPSHEQQNVNVQDSQTINGKTTAPIKLVIKSAEFAKP